MEQSDLPPSPPNADKTWRTVKDDRWQLENATGDGWDVSDISIVENPNHGGEVPLEATLEHTSGAVLVCTALDPWGHMPGTQLLRAHRIRLNSPTIDTPLVVT